MEAGLLISLLDIINDDEINGDDDTTTDVAEDNVDVI